MNPAGTTVTSEQLINNVIPKLKTVEFILDTKLRSIIANSKDASQRSRYEVLQNEFQLELMMIQMNLDHLLTRYADILQPTGKRPENTLLDLDGSEQVALSAVANLYSKVSEFASNL